MTFVFAVTRFSISSTRTFNVAASMSARTGAAPHWTIVFSVANSLVLNVPIRAENAALGYA